MVGSAGESHSGDLRHMLRPPSLVPPQKHPHLSNRCSSCCTAAAAWPVAPGPGLRGCSASPATLPTSSAVLQALRSSSVTSWAACCSPFCAAALCAWVAVVMVAAGEQGRRLPPLAPPGRRSTEARCGAQRAAWQSHRGVSNAVAASQPSSCKGTGLDRRCAAFRCLPALGCSEMIWQLWQIRMERWLCMVLRLASRATSAPPFLALWALHAWYYFISALAHPP